MRALLTLASWIALIVASSHASSQFGRDLEDTCQSFIKSVEEADETMDQSRPNAYGDVAERMFAAFNNVVVEAGLPALPFAHDANARTDRLIVIAKQCRSDMRLEYHNAVADAYVALREAAGLPVEAPRR